MDVLEQACLLRYPQSVHEDKHQPPEGVWAPRRRTAPMDRRWQALRQGHVRRPRAGGNKCQGRGHTLLKSSLSFRNTTEVIRKRKHNPPARFAKTCLPESRQAFCLKRHSEQSRARVTVHTGDWALNVKMHSITEASFPVFSFALMQWMIKVNLTPQ